MCYLFRVSTALLLQVVGCVFGEPVSPVVLDDSALFDELIERVAQPFRIAIGVGEHDADIRLRVAPVVFDDPDDDLREGFLRRWRVIAHTGLFGWSKEKQVGGNRTRRHAFTLL